MSEKRPKAEQPKSPDEAVNDSDQAHPSNAEKAAEIAAEKEKSGAESVV